MHQYTLVHFFHPVSENPHSHACMYHTCAMFNNKAILPHPNSQSCEATNFQETPNHTLHILVFRSNFSFPKTLN